MKRKIIASILAILLCMSLIPTYIYAKNGTANISMALSDTSVDIDDTITVAINTTGMTVSSFTFNMTFDKNKFECLSIVGSDPEYPNDIGINKTSGKNTWVGFIAASTISEANTSGTVGFALVGTDDVEYEAENSIVTITFKALSSGTGTFTLTEDSSGADGFKNTVSSTNVSVTSSLVNAEMPTITSHPQGATYTKDAGATALSVTANVSDSGTLSYQWFKNSTNSNTGGTQVATTATYTPDTTTVGTAYYYVVVTNTNNSVSGTKTATAKSNAACIVVNEKVNAQTPTITAQPQGATYVHNASATALSVTANVTDGGTLSYQWYSNTNNNTTTGTPISGATSSTYLPMTTAVGTTYYYVIITNTNNGASGTKTASITSNAVSITVETLVNAETPNITAHPQGATYTKDANATNLSVTANVTDSGTLTYQWYSNATNNNTTGTSINGATSATYTPPTTTVGTKYYYVVVTNTNNSVNGTKTATATSNPASITVNELVNAVTPTITAQPQGATYTKNAPATALSVTASVTDSGTLTYQWYSNASNSTTGGTAISGATSATYTPSTSILGTTYYYVVITNTNTNLSVTGSQTATVSSSTAKIEVVSATHTISFNSDGGGTFSDITVYEGGTYGSLPTPTKAGYKFDGWFTQAINGTEITGTTVVNLGDTATTQTLYAHWTEKATITINETPQTDIYDGTAKAFAVNSTPSLGDFSVTYSPANPTNAGSYDVTVEREEDPDYKAFSTTITDGLVINPLEITSITDLPTASSIKTGQALSSSTLIGGDNRFTYAWTDSTVIPSLGTSAQNVTVTLKNTQNYTYTGSNPISVNVTVSEYIAPTITTLTLPNGTINNPYSQTITATGESGYPITFTLDSGNLPTGLTLNSNGTISGTPTATGLYTFTIKATNIGGSAPKQYTVEIKAIPQLAAPTNITFVNGTVSWTAVTGAGSYKVVLYKDSMWYAERTTTNTSYNFTGIIKDIGEYTVTVQAIGDGSTSLSSIASGASTSYHYASTANDMAYWMWIQQQIMNQKYKIKATAEKGGEISPDGTVEVKAGNNQEFTITADDGYKIADVIVDGVSVGAVDTYKFKRVYEAHKITVTFEKLPEPVKEKTPAKETAAKEQVPEKAAAEVEPEWKNPFKDISKTDSYYEAVKYVYENGLFNGTAADIFDPDVTMNRAMFVTVLGRYAGVDVSEYTEADTMFNDAEADQWYTPYIQWAYENNLIYGYGDGNFGTFDIIIQEHMYLIMERFFEMMEIDYTFEQDEATSKDEVKRHEVAELLYEMYTELGE